MMLAVRLIVKSPSCRSWSWSRSMAAPAVVLLRALQGDLCDIRQDYCESPVDELQDHRPRFAPGGREPSRPDTLDARPRAGAAGLAGGTPPGPRPRAAARGTTTQYHAGHIPGARHLNYQDLAVTDRSAGGLTLQMLPADTLQQRLAAAGISTQSRIVVYFGRENPLVSPTARVMFTLDYAGLGEQSSLLDGGLEAWVKAGRPLNRAARGAHGRCRR